VTTTDPASSSPARGRRPVGRGAAAAAVMLTAAALAGGAYTLGRGGHVPTHDGSAGTHGTSIQDRAAQVMPFDLDRTTHTFTKTATGGVEQVVADSASDLADIDLVRGHLRREAERFARGDFSDSARIHGDDMPGLRALVAADGRLSVEYTQVPTGARITYSSADPTVSAAVHAWFDAQNSDHAMPGMGGSPR
jgi:hypothetical protein